MKLLFVDVETGGLDPNTHSLLSIGLVAVDDGVIKDKREYFVKHNVYNVTAKAMEINNLDIKLIDKNGLSVYDVVNAIREFCNKNFGKVDKITVAGHNVAFDIKFLNHMFEKNFSSFNRFNHRTVDTSTLILAMSEAGMFGNNRVTNLDEALNFYGLNNNVRHSALGDAEMTANLYIAMVNSMRKLFCGFITRKENK